MIRWTTMALLLAAAPAFAQDGGSFSIEELGLIVGSRPDPKDSATMADDPYLAYNFKLILDGQEAGGFVEASGLGTEIDVIPYREGGANAGLRHLPGSVHYRPLELRYGISKSEALWDWVGSALSGDPSRRDVSIVLLDNDGTTVAFRWNLSDAWVSAWQAGRLEASTGETAIESMTIVYEALERD